MSYKIENEQPIVVISRDDMTRRVAFLHVALGGEWAWRTSAMSDGSWLCDRENPGIVFLDVGDQFSPLDADFKFSECLGSRVGQELADDTRAAQQIEIARAQCRRAQEERDEVRAALLLVASTRMPAVGTPAMDDALNAMILMRGFVVGMLGATEAAAPRDLLHRFDAAMSRLITATGRRDEGAFARCSYCGRYSVDPEVLSGRERVVCDCGEHSGWCGSFQRPGEGARFAFGRHVRVTGDNHSR